MSCGLLEEFSYNEQIFSEKLQGQIQNVAGDSGGDFDEKTKEPVVLRRGRFKVTSESVDVEKVQILILSFLNRFYEIKDIKLLLCFLFIVFLLANNIFNHR